MRKYVDWSAKDYGGHLRTPKHHIVSLIKITNYYQDAIEGNLYFNRLQYYREAEMKERADEFETTAVSKPLYRLVDEDLFPCPVFCMYTVEAKENNPVAKIQLDDIRLKSFGSHAVVITNLKEFIYRIDTRLPEFNYKVVRYIDMKNPTGKDKPAIFTPIVTKDKYFTYQREFRIFSHNWALSTNTDYRNPNINYVDTAWKKFSVGSLKDITQLHPIDDLFSGIRVELTIDWDFSHRDRFQTRLPKAG